MSFTIFPDDNGSRLLKNLHGGMNQLELAVYFSRKER
jgi:hypothetical protein